MGLFGGLLKGIGKIAGGVVKAVASKATGGLSDLVLAKVAPKGKTNQTIAAQAKYSSDGYGRAPTPSERKAGAFGMTPGWAMSEDAQYLTAAQPPVTREGRAPRPCKFGPRGPDGYCPPRPPKGSVGAGRPKGSVRAARPCKYGPRGEDGYCPPRPSRNGDGPRGGGLTYSDYRARDRATRISRQIATSGSRLVGAAAGAVARKAAESPFLGGKVLSGGLKMTAARLGVAAAAGLAAYKITKAIVVRGMEEKQRQHQKALQDAFLAARDSAEEQLGRVLTPSELAQLDAEVEQRIGSLP